jgi:hypothetical protein
MSNDRFSRVRAFAGPNALEPSRNPEFLSSSSNHSPPFPQIVAGEGAPQGNSNLSYTVVPGTTTTPMTVTLATIFPATGFTVVVTEVFDNTSLTIPRLVTLVEITSLNTFNVRFVDAAGILYNRGFNFIAMAEKVPSV